VTAWDGASFDYFDSFSTPVRGSPRGLAVRCLVYEFDLVERVAVGEPLYESPRIEVPTPFNPAVDPPLAITIPVYPTRPLEAGVPSDGPRCVERPGQKPLGVCSLLGTKSYIFIVTSQGAGGQSTFIVGAYAGGKGYDGYENPDSIRDLFGGIDKTPDYYPDGLDFILTTFNNPAAADAVEYDIFKVIVRVVLYSPSCS
jgi:hypothetical protein